MSEETTVVEDNINADVNAQNNEEHVEEAPDYSNMEQDKLIEMLQSRDDELAKSKKSYDELRSMNDKRFNESSERMAKLEGILQERQAQATPTPEIDRSEIIKEMKARIEEDPANTVEIMMEFADEMQAAIDENNKQRDEIFQKRLAEQNPVYKANKDFVDRAVKGGMSFEDAIEFAAEVKSNEVSQPGTPKAPGVVEASRSTSSSQPVSAHQFSRQEIAMMKASGLDDNDIKEMGKEIAKDMAKAGV